MSRAAPSSAGARRRLRVALLGSRGIPARYGGYETLMEELSRRLVERGLDVTVYCRSHYADRSRREHHGVRLAVLPTLRTKHLDTPVHTLLSAIHAAFGRYDAALVVNAANALFVPLLRCTGTPTALHVDGLEQERAKWGAFGRWVYRVSELLACRLPTALVTDAEVIQRHFEERRGKSSTMIPYGVEPAPPRDRAVLERLGLRHRGFVLYVSRFEPENNPHRVVEAYRDVPGETPLVMVGDAPYARSFIEAVRASADPRVIFPGAIYGDGYRELLDAALVCVHATEVGGTHPALVEAMGYGNCVLVHDTPENREVAGAAGLYFDVRRPGNLAEMLARVLADPKLAARHRELARARAKERFSWEAVTDRYVRLFERLAVRGGS
ncbi:MAG TPA: glycosyltransferase [Thermoanaerobaculia bacterium]|nr:glycosyltransferase [Thermoanaerobaculia bacterium]